MKIVKWILIPLLILIALFFAMGLVNSSIEYGHTVKVNKNVKEAWAVTEDESKLDQWLAGFVSEDLLRGEQNKVGSQYKVVVKPSPEEDAFEMIETLVARDEFSLLEMHFESDFGTFDQTMKFTAKGNQTEIATESIVSGGNVLTNSMVGWMELLGGSFQKQEEENINKLKKVIEENTTDYFPGEGEGNLD